MFELTDDQQKALDSFTDFLTRPDEEYMIIAGSAGTGKSTLIKYLAKVLKAQYEMYSLLLRKNVNKEEFEFVLTATTNKAANVVSDLVGTNAGTIHSLLRVKPVPDFKTGKMKLVKNKDYALIYNKLIILDEGSMIDDRLFDILDETTLSCKIVIVGDQYQLAPIKQKVSIMETLKCRKVTMNKVMRHSGPILHTSAQFRETVETGIFKDIPVHAELTKVDGPTFQKLVNKAFTDPNYSVDTAKILAWTNDKVMAYNRHIRKIKGYPTELKPGEIVYTNNPIISSKGWHRPTDSQIVIHDVGPIIHKYGIDGRMISFSKTEMGFLPESRAEAKAQLKYLAKQKNWFLYYQYKDSWLDLRPAFASTCHKSQGSTYETVFIDLSDIGKCHIASDVARMLYVSISRAAKQVYFYGELPPKYQEI